LGRIDPAWFPSQSWLTFRQALSLGGNVMKGERGTTVVYADRFIPDDEKKRVRETGEETQAIPFLKRFTVFNAAQCEGLPEDVAVEALPPPTRPDRAEGRGADQGRRPRLPHRRQPRLLRSGPRLCISPH
jgi:antirestriction protein ArdC